jgi:hypothetical protein
VCDIAAADLVIDEGHYAWRNRAAANGNDTGDASRKRKASAPLAAGAALEIPEWLHTRDDDTDAQRLMKRKKVGSTTFASVNHHYHIRVCQSPLAFCFQTLTHTSFLPSFLPCFLASFLPFFLTLPGESFETTTQGSGAHAGGREATEQLAVVCDVEEGEEENEEVDVCGL